jgi:hypothetical protein
MVAVERPGGRKARLSATPAMAPGRRAGGKKFRPGRATDIPTITRAGNTFIVDCATVDYSSDPIFIGVFYGVGYILIGRA